MKTSCCASGHSADVKWLEYDIPELRERVPEVCLPGHVGAPHCVTRRCWQRSPTVTITGSGSSSQRVWRLTANCTHQLLSPLSACLLGPGGFDLDCTWSLSQLRPQLCPDFGFYLLSLLTLLSNYGSLSLYLKYGPNNLTLVNFKIINIYTGLYRHIFGNRYSTLNESTF